VAASVMGNDPIATQDEIHHLCVPIVRGQGPSVVKHDWLPAAPVLIEDLDSVFGSDRIHLRSSRIFRTSFALFGLRSERTRLHAPLSIAQRCPINDEAWKIRSCLPILRNAVSPVLEDPAICVYATAVFDCVRIAVASTQSAKVPATS
jgi:hypothetical protein